MAFSLSPRFQRLVAVALIAPVLAACGDRRTFDTVEDCAHSKRYTQTQCQNAFNRASGLPVEEDWSSSNPEENPVVLSAAQLQAEKARRAQMARDAAAAAAAIAGALLDAADDSNDDYYEQERERPRHAPRHRETRPPETKVPAPATRVEKPSTIETPSPRTAPESRAPRRQETERYMPPKRETERYQPPVSRKQTDSAPAPSTTRRNGFGKPAPAQ